MAARNMDGELDVRKVTVTHSILFATDRDVKANAPAPDGTVPAASPASYRTVSLMWPGILGTLTGVNETGLYICENAGDTQPDSGIISGLAPVACVQQAALRQLDGRTLTVSKMKDFLEKQISKTGWDTEAHKKITEAERAEKLQREGVPQYVSETSGGCAGPGSIFVVALPPVAASAASSSSSSASSASPTRGFVVEADRTHTSFRLPSQAPPFLPSCLLATNHFFRLGLDEKGVLGREEERARARIPTDKKCLTVSPAYSHGPGHLSTSLTNWNVPLSLSTLWRYEAGSNRVAAWQRQGRKMEMNDVHELLRVMCPGETEHAFGVELRPDGRVIVSVAVADARAGFWDAPYAKWQSFDFHDLFE